MSDILFLAVRSVWHRRIPTILTMLSISLSVALFVGVEKTKDATRDAFSGAISRVDLIVGPRTGSLSLLLYSVFHVGSPTHNVSMKSVEYARSRPEVNWVVPFSLGDGFRGFPVVGTTPDFFERYKYRDGYSISLSTGHVFAGDSDVVVGSAVAQTLGLHLGDRVVLSHGHTEDGDGFEKHEDHPFELVGIIAPTGSPLDKSVYVSLVGLGEIHRGLGGIGEHDGDEGDSDKHHDDHGSFEEKDGKLVVTSVSGFFLGAKNRMDSLNLQRTINTYDGDALLAILPGMAMGELWKNLSMFETALSVVSFFVVVAGVLGLFVSLYIISGQRQREMMVLRAVGAGPSAIFALLAGEALCLVAGGVVLGSGVMYIGMNILKPWIETKFSVNLNVSGIKSQDLIFAGCLLMVGCLVGVLSSVKAYRSAMHDGLGTKF
ncbi:MAG: FtsX-like permease family protein [Pseudomonadota bacterium]